MPPKTGDSKKTEKKKQEKIIEDKTFGLKNKNKSKQVQKYIKGVAHIVKNQGAQKSMSQLQSEEFERKKQKEKEEKEQALLNSLFKNISTVKSLEKEDERVQKVKVCPYFKQGLCQKGKKCNLSHDLSQETNNNEDPDIYTDQRTQLFGHIDENENMDSWDKEKLQKVIDFQQAKYKSQKPTEIVCRFFLDAVENNKYSWKWLCPNGMTCQYRHCLPPNYVFKKNQKMNQQMVITENIEEEIEEEKLKLSGQVGTKVTLEIFLKWKEEKAKRKAQEIEQIRQTEAKKTGSKGMHILNGRALFSYDPNLFNYDDNDAAGTQEYENRSEKADEEEEEEKKQGYFEENQQSNQEELKNQEEIHSESRDNSKEDQKDQNIENVTFNQQIEGIEKDGNKFQSQQNKENEDQVKELKQGKKKKKKNSQKKKSDQKELVDAQNIKINENLFSQDNDELL